MSASEATLAAALQQLMRDWDIYDALTLQAVLENDAGFARALAPALWLLLQEAGPSRSSTGTMTDGDAVVEAYVQTCLAGNVVDTSTTEAWLLRQHVCSMTLMSTCTTCRGTFTCMARPRGARKQSSQGRGEPDRPCSRTEAGGGELGCS